MTSHFLFDRRAGLTLAIAWLLTPAAWSQPDPRWKIHDMDRPRPAKVDPGANSTQDQPGRAPSDAVVLFDGQNLDQWRSLDGRPAKWIVRDGYMESVAGSGYIRTLRNFGDCQLHVEFATPVPAQGTGQGRGNSGVFLMTAYEVQVLDSYENETYADGQASAVYAQYPPLVNASRPPGQWQTYDIVFARPRFDDEGGLISPAVMTVFHNGVLVHHNVELSGPTGWLSRSPYSEHPDKLPISLQDHGNPVRYRNIWVRELGSDTGPAEFTFSQEFLKRYEGEYEVGDMTVRVRCSPLRAVPGGSVIGGVLGIAAVTPSNLYAFPLEARSKTEFVVPTVDIRVTFDTNEDGEPTGGMTFKIGRDGRRGTKR